MFERYMAGEHERVWKELVGLGTSVRQDPHAADALAIAFETMQRVDANVRTLAERLAAIGYEFKTQAMEADEWIGRSEQAMSIDLDRFKNTSGSKHVQQVSEMAQRAREMLAEQVANAKQKPRDRTIRAHVPPGPQAFQHLRRLEKLAGPVPLSLRAFYEVVGSVDFIGYHPSLAPRHGRVCPDPLVVWGLADALAERDASGEDEGTIIIAPDDLHKADTSGGAPYVIAVPDSRADAELLNERHNLFFVDYLRLAYRFGGFPGWEGIEGAPGEIKNLKEGLVAF